MTPEQAVEALKSDLDRLARLGNVEAREGRDRCACGCKYWEHDHCIDCGEHVRHAERLS